MSVHASQGSDTKHKRKSETKRKSVSGREKGREKKRKQGEATLKHTPIEN